MSSSNNPKRSVSNISYIMGMWMLVPPVYVISSFLLENYGLYRKRTFLDFLGDTISLSQGTLKGANSNSVFVVITNEVVEDY